MARGPVEVVLEEAALPHNGTKLYFVMIVNVPHAGSRGALVITQAWPLAKATAIKEKVENALHLYRRPKKARLRKARPSKAKTVWARIQEDT